MIQEMFEDTKGVIKSCNSEKDIQCKGQMKKDNGIQIIPNKTKD